MKCSLFLKTVNFNGFEHTTLKPIPELYTAMRPHTASSSSRSSLHTFHPSCSYQRFKCLASFMCGETKRYLTVESMPIQAATVPVLLAA